MQTPDFTLSRNTLGKLVMTLADGTSHEGVVPVRAFPISAATDGFSLMSTDGRELAWITRLDALPEPTRPRAARRGGHPPLDWQHAADLG